MIGWLLLVFLITSIIAATVIFMVHKQKVKNDIEEASNIIFNHKTRCEYPGGEDNGVIMVAGGKKYGPLGLRAVKKIRSLSPNLKIHIFGLDEDELQHESMIELSNMSNVYVSHLDQKTKSQEVGWQCKIKAIIACNFENVFLIDADNVPLQPIHELFELDVFKENSAIMWRDIEDKERPISILGKHVNFPYLNSVSPNGKLLENLNISIKHQHESGQLLVNRRKSWKALDLIAKMNDASGHFYNLMHGDKDTYQIGFKATETSFYEVPFRPSTGGYLDDSGKYKKVSLIQYHPTNGKPMFSHCAGSIAKKKKQTITHVMKAKNDDDTYFVSLLSRQPEFEHGIIEPIQL